MLGCLDSKLGWFLEMPTLRKNVELSLTSYNNIWVWRLKSRGSIKNLIKVRLFCNFHTVWHYGYHPKLNRFELLPFFHLYLTSRAKDTALLHFAVSRQTKALIYSFRIQKKKSPSSSLLHYEDDTLLVSTISYCPEHNRSFIFRQRSKRWDNVKPCNKLALHRF